MQIKNLKDGFAAKLTELNCNVVKIPADCGTK